MANKDINILIELPSPFSTEDVEEIKTDLMTSKAVAERLFAFNKWRTGKDERTMDEAGLKPKQITLDIEFAIKKLQKL